MTGAPSYRHPPLQAGWIDSPHRFGQMGDLRLESGEVIQRCAQSFVAHGKLSPAKDNAVLVCISLTGNHHRLDFLIGPGRALDTDRFFIVCADPLGNGLSTSPSNSQHQPGMRFPRFTIRDMVHAQYRLMTETLGIPRLHAVVGASMGGMQALQWAVSHPDFAANVVAMTPMAKTHPWAALAVAAARACLKADPTWSEQGFHGVPDRGWRAYTALMTALLSRTPAAVADLAPDTVAARHWLDRLTEQNLANGFDAHDYLYQSWAYEAHDVGETPGAGGDVASALTRVRATTLILAPPVDLFNPAESARIAARQIPGARFVEIPSQQGHQAATATRADDAAFLNRVIREFLMQ